MDQKVANVKKWGWWAVVGLVALLVIAGLIIAIATSGPKPSDEVATDETSNQDENTEQTPSGNNDEDNTSEEEKTTPELPTISETPSVDLPKTGPEDSILPILAAGIVGSAIGYGAVALRRR